MTDRIVPLIMCGGAGTRLWPLSRERLPKQFVSLFGGRSTFQDAVLRVSDPRLFARPIVVTGAAYRFMALEQLAEIGLQADILLESARRESGPAIAAGSLFAQNRDPDAVVLALAADHVVKDGEAFVAACEMSLGAAQAGRIVTFGIAPDRPASEYGYILPGDVIAGQVRAVATFVEKPDRATAERYLRTGYLWNSGNFMFRAEVLLNEYRKVDPASIAAVAASIDKAERDLAFVTLDKASFESATSISIDYAVMEKTAQAAVLPASFRWSDIGSWRAVWELSDKDADGNAAQGPAIFDNSQNCSVSTDKAVVALEGVHDLVVIATQDAVLVSRQADPEGLKRLVARLKSVEPRVTEEHVRVHRPWGSYQSLDSSERHQVRRVTVKPGQRLPPQHPRSGHWVVLDGVARVTIDGVEKIVGETQSIFIPADAAHSLENIGEILLELIEVRIEDDRRAQ